MSVLQIQRAGSSFRIPVRVKPRAAKSRILEVRDGILQVAIAAPPVDGAANSELIQTLARALGCGKSALEIVTGAGSRSKLVAIVGLAMSEPELLAKLGQTGK